MKKPKKFSLQFGALAPKIAAQLKAQGVYLRPRAKWQEEADAITQLAIAGLLSDSEKTRARQRLIRTIAG